MLHYHFNPVSLKFKQRLYDNFCQVNIDHKLVTHFFCSPDHRPSELLSWLSIRHPSVSFSHLNLLLWNHWTELNQTCQKCLWMVLYQICVFGADLKSNMVARVHNWLTFKKSSCQKPPSQLNCDLAGMIIGWSCTKLVNRLPIRISRWPPWLDLV